MKTVQELSEITKNLSQINLTDYTPTSNQIISLVDCGKVVERNIYWIQQGFHKVTHNVLISKLFKCGLDAITSRYTRPENCSQLSSEFSFNWREVSVLCIKTFHMF